MDLKRIYSLIALLDDPDPEVHQVVLKQLESLEPDYISVLEQEEIAHPELTFQIKGVVRTIRQKNLLHRIHSWFDTPNDLLQILFFISQIEYSGLKLEEIKENAGLIVKEIWLELNENLTALERISIINHILFQNKGFKIIPWNNRTPDCYMINFLLNRRTGSGLIITILYLYIAKELGLNIYGINVPEGYFLAYYDQTGLYKKIDEKKSSALFYINPSNEGAVIGRAELEHIISEKGYTPKNEHFRPIDDKFYLKRLIVELKYCYEEKKNYSKAESMDSIYRLLKQKGAPE